GVDPRAHRGCSGGRVRARRRDRRVSVEQPPQPRALRTAHGVHEARAPPRVSVSVAVLADVHGNLPALDAVLADIDALDVGAVVVCGDVSSGPMPVETLDALRERNAQLVRGNADRVLDLVGANTGETWVRARYWVAERLGDERLAFLAGLPLDLTLDVEGL